MLRMTLYCYRHSRQAHWILLFGLALLSIGSNRFIVLLQENDYRSLDESSQHGFSNLHAVHPKYYYTKYADVKDVIESCVVANQTSNTKTEQPEIWTTTTKSITHCREKCCAEAVWIGLERDERKLLNWRSDVQELSDVMIQEFDDRFSFVHATNLHSEDLIPCLVPNTILMVDNFGTSNSYFWQQIRPRIRVPYLLLSGGSDNDTPYSGRRGDYSTFPEYLADPLLVKLYGTNPRVPPEGSSSQRFVNNRSKFVPMLSGLSYHHPQEQYLKAYLETTNYTNPFTKHFMEERYLNHNNDADIDFDRDVFVHFGSRRNPARARLWKILCPNTTVTHTNTATTMTSSCHSETNRLQLHKIYTDMTNAYRFGISPIGLGYDCYRHYELWYLGLIPVVWERGPESRELYRDLPVVFLNNSQRLDTREDFVVAIREYLSSHEFEEGIATGRFARGWNRLFLRDKRTSILGDANRFITVMPDGKEYYRAYRYFLKDERKQKPAPLICHNAQENCAVREDDGGDRSYEWVDDPDHEYNRVDEEWMRLWLEEEEKDD